MEQERRKELISWIRADTDKKVWSGRISRKLRVEWSLNKHMRIKEMEYITRAHGLRSETQSFSDQKMSRQSAGPAGGECKDERQKQSVCCKRLQTMDCIAPRRTKHGTPFSGGRKKILVNLRTWEEWQGRLATFVPTRGRETIEQRKNWEDVSKRTREGGNKRRCQERRWDTTNNYENDPSRGRGHSYPELNKDARGTERSEHKPQGWKAHSEEKSKNENNQISESRGIQKTKNRNMAAHDHF